jgi:Na+-driven multidrug efflux pump
MSLSALAIAEGNARVSMIGMIIGASLNTILDAIFIITMDMGIKGAALATVVAQVISCLYLLRYYFWGNSYLKIRPGNLIPEVKILKDILAIGVASLARTIATSISAVFVNRLLVTYGGDLAISAYGIVHRLMIFVVMPGMVVGQGLQPILGFNYGARRYDRALKAITIAAVISTSAVIAGFVVMQFYPELFIRIFTADAELVVLGAHVARLVFLCMYLLGPIMLGSLIFQSIGKARQSFATSIARSLFLIPLVFLLAPSLEVDGVLLAFPCSDALSFLLTLLLAIPEIREFRRLAHQRKN